jgi:ribose/xylose/arabinose/galactoside ABC-type transport system permease subunit
MTTVVIVKRDIDLSTGLVATLSAIIACVLVKVYGSPGQAGVSVAIAWVRQGGRSTVSPS